MKKILLIVLILLLFCGCSNSEDIEGSSMDVESHRAFLSSQAKETFSTSQPIVEDGLSFDPQEDNVVNRGGIIEREFGNPCFEDQEKLVREQTDWDSSDDYGILLVGEVAGKSMNRILQPPAAENDFSRAYGENHVLTPIRIKKIIYLGSGLSYTEGEKVHLIEKYF